MRGDLNYRVTEHLVDLRFVDIKVGIVLFIQLGNYIHWTILQMCPKKMVSEALSHPVFCEEPGKDHKIDPIIQSSVKCKVDVTNPTEMRGAHSPGALSSIWKALLAPVATGPRAAITKKKACKKV